MKINIKDIDMSATYEGYLWLSDQSRPCVLRNESLQNKCPDCFESLNPFVVEGYLYDKDNGLSLSIRQIDGEYFVIRTDVKTEDTQELRVVRQDYVPHRMPGIKKLRFLQYWRMINDPMCMNMSTYQPAETVFLGFEYE